MNDFNRGDRFGGKRSGGGFGRKPFGKPSFGGKPGFGRPQGQMHPATCAQCGKPTEVPFRPDGQRPIYCSDCFRGKEAVASRAPGPFAERAVEPSFGRDYRKTPLRAPLSIPAQVAKPDPRIDVIIKDIAKLQNTVNQILLGIVVTKAQAGIEASVVRAPKKTTNKSAPTKKKK